MKKTKTNLKFWIGLMMFGKALQGTGTKNMSLFEDYEYSTPFRLPKLEHPVLGKTFTTTMKEENEKDIAGNKAEKICEFLEETENIDMIPIYAKAGATTIKIKLKPMNNIKKSFNLQRQIKYVVGNEETRIYSEGDKIVVEIPYKGNKVLFGDFMQDENYRLMESKTIVPIGKKVDGTNVYGDLEKMPHMLVAGTTGSGKSVFLNDVITALLMKNTAYDLNMILIDPKMVEFKRYSKLKYVKYVTENNEAVDILGQLNKEMDKRYELMANNGCRNISDYNKKFPEYRLPKIVLVIDEMADIISNKVYGKKVEANIIRLAQKARASGIHMILATQRPSREVITGQIKANIPCRVCLSVMTRTDSMVVLDKIGGEKLQGHGDLLYLDGMSNKEPLRLQAGLIEDNEIVNVVMQLAMENQPTTLDEIDWSRANEETKKYFGRETE